MESDTGVEGEEENSQLEEEDGVGESSQYWLQLEKVALTDALDLPFSRVVVGCIYVLTICCSLLVTVMTFGQCEVANESRHELVWLA